MSRPSDPLPIRLSPAERADKVRAWAIEGGHWSFPDDLLPPGSVILTAEEWKRLEAAWQHDDLIRQAVDELFDAYDQAAGQ